MSAVSSSPQTFNSAKGPPTSHLDPTSGGWNVLGRASHSGIVKFEKLCALPSPSKLRRGFDFGLQLCLPAGILRGLRRSHPRRFHFSPGLALLLGRHTECAFRNEPLLLIVRFGVYVFLFSLTQSAPPALVGSRFLL